MKNNNIKNIRLDKFIFNFLKGLAIDLPTPKKISYWWNFGSCLLLFLIVQIVRGLLLAMNFLPEASMAFYSVDYLMRDIKEGWLVRALHTNGASFYFLFLYLHMGRGLYYNSFFYQKTWLSGLLILVVSMAIAFFGYVLPWGNMSYWGAAVITNLFSVIPYFGLNFVKWVWGGFSVVSATLTRFFVLHFLLPFIVIFIVFLHIMFLHETGSNNPLGINSNNDKIMFYPYFGSKDMFGYSIVFLFFFFCCFLYPYIFLCPENFMEANILSTPEHIEPDWFLLLPYAILRSIPKKLGGVIGLASTIIVLFLVPFIFLGINRGNQYKNRIQRLFWWWVFIFLILSFIGASPVESPYIELGQLFGLCYFFYFLFISLYVL